MFLSVLCCVVVYCVVTAGVVPYVLCCVVLYVLRPLVCGGVSVAVLSDNCTLQVANALGGVHFDGLVALEQNGTGGAGVELYDAAHTQSFKHRINLAIRANEAPLPVARRHFRNRPDAFEWVAQRHLGFLSPGGRAPDVVVDVVLPAISESASASDEVTILADPRLHATFDRFFLLQQEFEQTQVLPNIKCPVLFVLSEDGPCSVAASSEHGRPSLEDRWKYFNAPVALRTTQVGGHYPHVDGRSIKQVAQFISNFVLEIQNVDNGDKATSSPHKVITGSKL